MLQVQIAGGRSVESYSWKGGNPILTSSTLGELSCSRKVSGGGWIRVTIEATRPKSQGHVAGRVAVVTLASRSCNIEVSWCKMKEGLTLY